MALGSVSLNMVWNPAISGSNFLQASMKGIHTYAGKLHKVNILGATKFPLLNKNIKSLSNHLGHIRTQTAKISANPIKLDIQTSATNLKEARKDMTAIEHDAKQVAFWTKKSADNLRAGTTAQKRAGNNKIGAGVSVAGGVGMAYILSKPFKASIDFESNMADVKALTKNITTDDFTLLTAKAKELGATTEWSASQSAQGMVFLAKAGFDTKQQLGAMAGVLGLATAGNVDLATSSDIASNILSSFGIEANKMGMVSDVLAKTFTTSNTDLVMLGETMKYTAPIANSFGVGLTEVSALAGKLGDVGIQGSMAGTSLASMYTRLSAPPTEAKKALDSLGISAFNAQGKFKGMPNIIGELNTKMAGMGDDTKAQKLKAIFGQEALKSAVSLIQIGEKSLLEYKSSLDNAGGTTSNIQKIKLDTTAGEFKLLGSAMESLSISATTGLLPTIRIISSGFKSVTGGLESFTQKYPNASKWVFGLGAAFIVGSVALAGFGLVASGVATAIGFISLPVLAVVGAISLVIAGGVALYKNWDVIKAKASATWNGIVTKIKSPFVSMFNWLNAKFQKVIDLKNKVLNLVGLGDKKEEENTLKKPKLLKNVPVNNVDYKDLFKTSSLTEIPAKTVELESPSKLSEIAISEQKAQMQMQNNTASKKQDNTFNIEIKTNGAMPNDEDIEMFKLKVQTALKEINADEVDTTFKDAS